MSKGLALSQDELALIREILGRHLPAGTRVFVFGSRATGRAKAWSDLDLSVEGDAPLPLDVIAALAEAFDESALSWKVDLVDRACVGEAFGRIIDAGKEPIFGEA